MSIKMHPVALVYGQEDVGYLGFDLDTTEWTLTYVSGWVAKLGKEEPTPKGVENALTSAIYAWADSTHTPSPSDYAVQKWTDYNVDRVWPVLRDFQENG